MQSLFIYPLEKLEWFQNLIQLQNALKQNHAETALASYKAVLRELVTYKFSDLADAFCDALVYSESVLGNAKDLAQGLERAVLDDLLTCQKLCQTNWTQAVSDLAGQRLPPLEKLAADQPNPFSTLKKSLLQEEALQVWERLKVLYQTQGTGNLARYKAFKFVQGAIIGINYPVEISKTRLVSLEKQLKSLEDNTKAFLQGFNALHCLLYGPRGSGKSTAVRSLLHSFADQGLRLIELSPTELSHLPELSEILRFRPHNYVLFVDDLNFEQGDTSYHPLKSMLEGSVSEKASNILIYATSNRRHLVKEQFSDRPDPLNDDVHGWDSQHEKLALSDRFGLTITFPSPSQSRYLDIVMGLAKQEGLSGETLRERAIRFADWGNGYSGRTAQQFIDSAKAGLA